MLKHCIFCQNREELKELYSKNFEDEELSPEIFSARRFSDRFHYRIVRCKRCGMVFSREILPDDVLAGLYAESKVTFGEYADIIRKDYLMPLKPYLKQMNKGSALEIGCSSGFFLDELLAQGFQSVYGCEPSKEAIEKASPTVKKNIVPGFFKRGLYKNDSFDMVCSFQTLDHLSDPLDAVRTSLKITRPGGIAYFIVHNVDSLQAKALGEKSPIIDVEHVYLFNKSTLSRLFSEAGFRVIKVGAVISTYPVSYWLRMLSFVKLAGWLNRIGIGKIRLPLKAGNIFIVARRE